MRTITLQITPARFAITKLLGYFWKHAWASRFAPLQFQTMPDPPLPVPDWVRVSNRMCGVCGSDLHQILLDADLNVAPTALPSNQRTFLGHEMIGQIIEIGPAVRDFHLGDRVVRWGRANDCRARGMDNLCPSCQRGHRVLCERASEPMHPQPVGGGFGDTFVTPANTLVPVPDTVSDEQAIFIEPLAVAIHAVLRGNPKLDEQVLVIGCGTIGLLLIQVLHTIAPQLCITAQAEFPWQAELAYQFGAAQTFLAHQDGYARVAEITGAQLFRGRGDSALLLGGFDVIYDVVGISATLNTALRWTRARGTVVLVGVNLHPMQLDLTPVWYQEVDLLGAIGHDVLPWNGQQLSAFEIAIQLLADGQVNPAPLLTHIFSLADYRQAFATALDKTGARAIKVAFDFRNEQKIPRN